MRYTSYLLAILGLLGAPLLGAYLADIPLNRMLVIPPMTTEVTIDKAPFSWVAFFVLLALILLVMLPFIVRILKAQKSFVPISRKKHPFPWWGWLGLVILLLGWLMAWTRFPWFENLQTYTFTPPWLGFILLVNALTYRRSGWSLITHKPAFLLALFVFSALFWWYFEYLNLMVENWFYVNTGDLSKGQFFLYATLPFSTVLPAVISTRHLISTFPRLTAGLDHFIPLKTSNQEALAWGVFLAGVIGLMAINFQPDFLYPLLWLAPTAILASSMALGGNTELFDALPSGNWKYIFSLALAALICGFFWELWNFNSFTQWHYSVPLVHRFQLFEMPILGYSGYLPFGLQCGLAAILTEKILANLKKMS
ncbi:MAG: hypothetical protein RBS53_05410 [Bacteroidales bacterium]|jgi:hypothetical protein|nr:hypothetical protein [Bacteroidales bacterium]